MKRGSLVSVGVLALGMSLPQAAFAASGADALLNAVQPSGAELAGNPTGAMTGAAAGAVLSSEIKLTDPFLMQFFSAWQAEKKLPYEVNAWALRVVKQQYREAAHLWSVVRSSLPDSFVEAATGAQLYLLWKLNLPQTFLDEWLEQVRKESFRESRIAQALEQTITPDFAAWVVENALVLTPEQEGWIGALPGSRGMVYTTLKAWINLRKGDRGAEVLASLPADHAMKVPLGESVALATARKGDLGAAGRIFKRELEPAIEAKKNPALLSRHYMEVARLLYQAGAIDASEQFYEKIPNTAPEYLKAREELAWVWLRKGDFSKLRGGLLTLGSNLFDERFSPEVHLVRAISNLKLCFYNEVRSDFLKFSETNSAWAKRITAAIRAEVPPAPTERDYFSLWADRALEQRQNEARRLESYGQESIAAALPAVGPQQHWIRARDRVLAVIETAKKLKADEYRRQWRNDEVELTEAVRKMKFVKVELLTQVRLAGRTEPGVVDSVKTSSAAPVGAPIEHQKSQTPTPKEGEQSFVFDGVIWPDELFRMRSVAPGVCLGHAQ